MRPVLCLQSAKDAQVVPISVTLSTYDSPFPPDGPQA